MSDDIPSDPPPVEPMSDMSWARIERGLLSRLDSGTTAPVERAPNRRWLYIAIPAVAAAAAIAVILAFQGGDAAKAPQVADTSDAQLDVEPSRVVSGDSPSTVSFGDAHLQLSAKTAIVMTREGGSPSVLLERGVVDLTVAPRDSRPPFVVRAGDTVVRVVGTQFQVARYEEVVKVKVEHGIVDVQFRGNTVRVGQGQAWSSEQPEVTQVASAEPVAPPQVDTPVETPTAEPQVVAPTAEEPKAEAPKVEAPKAGKPAVAKVEKPAAPVTSAEPATSMGIRKIDLDQLTFEKMQSLEVKDPQGAIAGYLQLSKGNGRWAANALYAAGRLAADRGDPRAKTFLTIYLRRFPSDDNVMPARTLLKRLEGE